jgi:selenocysteine lyase/cysteine desulfurase
MSQSTTLDAASAATVSASGADPLLPVVGGDLQVPLLDGSWCRYANLDYAASAPALGSVAAHVQQVLPYYASVHRGAGYASQVSTALLEDAREAVGDFVGARAGDVVVFTRHTTDALNLLAACVPTWGDVVFLDLEHHANLLPWQRLRHRCVAVEPTVEATLEALDDALAVQPAALLAITGASNVTGEELPVERIVRLAHRRGARVVVDAAQLAPHHAIDLEATGADYVAFSGHKLYAPYGCGVLVGRRDWLDQATPYLAGGGAVRDVSVSSARWAAAPARHEGGTPNVLGAVALARACRELRALPDGALEVHEAALRERLVDGLTRLPGVRLHRVFDDAPSSIGVVTFTVDGYDAGLVAAYLSAEHGIGVRDGRFCAHPLLERLGLDAAVRASVGVGSRTDDVDRLVAAVAELARRGTRADYERVDGRWQPAADVRPLPEWVTASAAGSSPCES